MKEALVSIFKEDEEMNNKIRKKINKKIQKAMKFKIQRGIQV